MSTKKILSIIAGLIIILGGYALLVKTGYAPAPSFIPMAGMPDIERAITVTAELPPEVAENYTNQIKDIQKTLKDESAQSDTDNWLMLGGLYEAIGDYDGAREVYEYINAVRPKNSTSYTNLGNLYAYRFHDNAAAEKYFFQSLENDPEIQQTYRSLFELYTFSDASKKGEDFMVQAVKKFPAAIDFHVYLARYYRTHDRINEAKVAYDGGIEAAVKANNTAAADQLRAEKAEMK